MSGWANPIRSSRIAGIAAAGILSYQLFAPGFVGLADNGDFPRLAGRFSLCPAEGWNIHRFRYFVPAYTAQSACYWNSQVPSSALLLTASARALSPGPRFPIRTLAAVHSGALIAFVALWPPLLLFCDLANTAYFNSFFSEGTALLALLAVAIAARALLLKRRNMVIAAYLIAALPLITSKLQHAPLALPLAAFLFHQIRWRAALPTAAFLIAAASMFLATPSLYKTTNLWNSIFISLAPQSPTALADLHLSPDYAVFSGHNAFQFTDQPAAYYWATRLSREAGHIAIARYYLMHPVLAFRRMAVSLGGLEHTRPDDLGNTQPSSGTPFTQSHRFDQLSAAKAALFQHAPYLAAGLYLLCGIVLFRSRYAPIAALLLSMATLEFLISTFADAAIDFRHHALLQQLCDLWLVFAAASVWERSFARAREAQSGSPPRQSLTRFLPRALRPDLPSTRASRAG